MGSPPQVGGGMRRAPAMYLCCSAFLELISSLYIIHIEAFFNTSFSSFIINGDSLISYQLLQTSCTSQWSAWTDGRWEVRREETLHPLLNLQATPAINCGWKFIAIYKHTFLMDCFSHRGNTGLKSGRLKTNCEHTISGRIGGSPADTWPWSLSGSAQLPEYPEQFINLRVTGEKRLPIHLRGIEGPHNSS